MLLSAVAYGKQMQEAKYMFCGSAFFEGLSGAALHVSESARIGRAPDSEAKRRATRPSPHTRAFAQLERSEHTRNMATASTALPTTALKRVTLYKNQLAFQER